MLLQVDLQASRIEDAVELTDACHQCQQPLMFHRIGLQTSKAPAPIHLCRGCGYWGMLLFSLWHRWYVEAGACLPLIGYWWGVQLIACWTYIHASGLPHRSSGSLSYTQGCEMQNRYTKTPCWHLLLERDLFDDSIIGDLVRHWTVVTLTKPSSSFLEGVWKVIAIKNNMDFVTFERLSVNDLKKMRCKISTSANPRWLSHRLNDYHSINNDNASLTSRLVFVSVRRFPRMKILQDNH